MSRQPWFASPELVAYRRPLRTVTAGKALHVEKSLTVVISSTVRQSGEFVKKVTERIAGRGIAGDGGYDSRVLGSATCGDR
jgi:hypothetical protein